MTLFLFEEAFFLDHGTLLPGLLTFPMAAARGIVGGDLARSGLEGAGEAAGGRLAGVAADGGVGVGRGAHGAEHRSGVERRGGLLPIVGIPRRALHIVDRPARRSVGRGRRQAGHLRIRLGVHCGLPATLNSLGGP